MSKILFILCLCIPFMPLQAQNQELKNAEDAFAKQDYAKTMQHISIMLNAPKQLRGDDLFKLHLLRAKTYINIFHNAIKAENEELIEANRDNYILAYQDILEAKLLSNTATSTSIEELNEVSGYLQGSLRLSGAGFLNNVYSNTSLNTAARVELLDEAQKYLLAAIKLDPKDYLTQDFYGQVMMLKRDKETALKYFKESISNYKILALEKTPDFSHFRVYANMAILYMQNKELEPALQILEAGKKKLNEVYDKSKLKNDLVELDFQRAQQNMIDIEMDIYLNAPSKRVEALVKFEKALAETPKDYSLRLAYASLLEQDNQKEKAIEQYKSAIETNKIGFFAYFNLGILYLNNGLEQYQQSNEVTAEVEKASWKEKAMNDFQLALPVLKNANDANPRDVPTLEALVLVTARLGLEEEYKFYRNQKKELEK
jgi:predicted Zn-dependent protease